MENSSDKMEAIEDAIAKIEKAFGKGTLMKLGNVHV